MMVVVGAFLVLVVVQAEDTLLYDEKLLLPPNYFPSTATSATDDPRTLSIDTDVVDWKFKKFPRIPGAGAAKIVLKIASCPMMCTFFCFGSGGIGWFTICVAPCLLTCFGTRPSDVTTSFISDCTMGCAKGLSTAYGIGKKLISSIFFVEKQDLRSSYMLIYIRLQ